MHKGCALRAPQLTQRSGKRIAHISRTILISKAWSPHFSATERQKSSPKHWQNSLEHSNADGYNGAYGAAEENDPKSTSIQSERF
jgi:hypothetical protein